MSESKKIVSYQDLDVWKRGVELDTLIIIAAELKYISKEINTETRKEIEELGKMLNSIIQKINARIME